MLLLFAELSLLFWLTAQEVSNLSVPPFDGLYAISGSTRGHESNRWSLKVFITWIIMTLYYNISTANKTHLLLILFMPWTWPELQHPISGGILVFVSITRAYKEWCRTLPPERTTQEVFNNWPGEVRRKWTLSSGSRILWKGNKMTRNCGHWSTNEWKAWVMNGLVLRPRLQSIRLWLTDQKEEAFNGKDLKGISLPFKYNYGH